MASLEHEKMAKPAEEPEVVVVVPPTETVEPEKGAPPSGVVSPAKLAVVEVVLRFLLFVGSVTAVVVMVTSKQTEMIPTPFPGVLIPYSSNFTDSPSFIYFVAAFSVAGLYSIITTLASGLELLKPGSCKQLLSHFVILDVLLLGIAAAAVGAAGGVGYIGLKGNSHSRWVKVCDRYDTFCQHLAGSIAAGLFVSIVLVLLILLSFFTLSRKIPK